MANPKTKTWPPADPAPDTAAAPPADPAPGAAMAAAVPPAEPAPDAAAAPATPSVESDSTVSALVQVDVHISGADYPAGAVLEGLPASIAQQYVGAVDPHPAAVAHAIAAGAQVLQFAAAEAD